MWTSKKYLKDLYSANHKLILASSEINNLNFVKEISDLDFYQYKATEKVILPWQETEASDLIEINLAPTFMLGFLVVSDQGKQELNSLRKWWTQKVPSDQLPPFLQLIPTNDPESLLNQFWRLLFHCLSSDHRDISQRLTTLQKQYFQLRQLYENTQNAFSAIEGYLSQAKLPPTQLTFDNAPSREMIIPNPNDNIYQIKQLLPLPGAGLATVELYISKIYLDSVGKLNISLIQPDDDSCLAQWSVPYQNLTEGLLSLDLPHVSIMPKNDVELLVEWYTDIGPAPCLSLGEWQPVPQFRIFADGNESHHSLALRLWTGLPGTRKVVSPYSFYQQTDKKNAISGHLGNAALSQLVQVTPNLPTDSFNHIQVDKKRNKILTHPRDEGLTIAMLPFCFPAGATHLTATICTENKQAKPIEYGLALIEEGMNPKTCFQEQNPNSNLSFSGWIAVEPLQERQIKLSIQPSATKFYHIVIAAKVPQGSSSNLGWAYWLNFFIESKPSV